MKRFLQRTFGALLALSLLTCPLGATWSIVVVNTRTGEVAVASATCLTGEDLRKTVPLILVGVGAGAAQSSGDTGAVNRMIMWDALLEGKTPDQVLTLLKTIGTFPQSRQYGIAAFSGEPVSFTGSGAGRGKRSVCGVSGDLMYAVQGNVLTSGQQVSDIKNAMLDAEGDLGQKIMAGMEMARSLGGDGRCSCDEFDPTSCGSPPAEFDKSAHIGFVIVARIGDTDGACDSDPGCANGDYYLNINAVTGKKGKDPVFKLQDEYAEWRADLLGRPDAILSEVQAASQSIVADGVTTTEVTVRLVDVDGVALTTGGHDVQVTPMDGSEASAMPGGVRDNGDGTYTFELTAGSVPGTATFEVTAADDLVTATLHPYLSLRVDELAPMHAGFDEISAMDAVAVPLVVNDAEARGASYIMLASLTGTEPGIPLGQALLPLQPDSLFRRTYLLAGDPHVLPGTTGRLDERGRAQGEFRAPPTALLELVGQRMSWAALYFDGTVRATNAVGFDIVP